MLIILKKYANNDGVPGESPESRQRRTFMRHWGKTSSNTNAGLMKLNKIAQSDSFQKRKTIEQK